MATVFTILSQILNYVLIFGLLYAIGLFLGLLIVREERARETSLRLDESNRKLVQYAAEVELLSTIQERNRLAREIHDNLGHYLTAVNMQLEVAQMHLPPDQDSVQTALDKAQTLTKEALSEIRRSISALRATPLENRTLPKAIELLVDEHQAAGNTVNFQVNGSVRSCSAVVEMALYRIAQEGLTNIRKHAHAASADLTLGYAEGFVSLQIHDNGLGTDHSEGGFGLLGIRERVQLLGGTVTIETAEGQGYKMRVSIPAS
jgi:signal transduction histidine kinase